MNKGKVARLAGFVGALGVSTVLVTTAIQGTGAYFEDSVNGNLHGSSGSLQITATNTNISFLGLNPGEDRSQTISFTNDQHSTTAADIWLVFDASSEAYGRFTGANHVDYGTYDEGGMGQYGHFMVQGDAGTFQSYNLQLPSEGDATSPIGYSDTTSRNTCSVNAYGLGGSGVTHDQTGSNPTDLAECGVPAAILLQQNLRANHTGHATITFGLTGKQVQQNQGNDPNVSFKIVATQPGVRPGAEWTQS